MPPDAAPPAITASSRPAVLLDLAAPRLISPDLAQSPPPQVLLDRISEIGVQGEQQTQRLEAQLEAQRSELLEQQRAANET